MSNVFRQSFKFSADQAAERFRVHLNLRSDSVPYVVPDISYARNRLGWEPTLSIEEGLIRTIKEFDRVRKANQKSFAGLSWVEIM